LRDATRARTLRAMSEAMRRRRELRREFLLRLYEHVDGSVSEFVAAADIGTALGMDAAESRRIFEYLEEKGFVLVDDYQAGIVRLTAAGVDEVEARA
jgi:Mn-dependent DtxR family transcriptional regulator